MQQYWATGDERVRAFGYTRNPLGYAVVENGVALATFPASLNGDSASAALIEAQEWGMWGKYR